LPIDAREQLGGPARHEVSIRSLDDSRVEISLTLRDKPANRMPEAGFFHLTPAGAAGWQLHKMGLWHRGDDIVSRGGGQLQAAEALRATMGGRDLLVRPLDSALVAPASSPFMPYQPEIPDYGAGVRFNLYNNKWGTNFPMWWEGSVMFRFVVELAR
jgi:hypothetical protein